MTMSREDATYEFYKTCTDEQKSFIRYIGLWVGNERGLFAGNDSTQFRFNTFKEQDTDRFAWLGCNESYSLKALVFLGLMEIMSKGAITLSNTLDEMQL